MGPRTDLCHGPDMAHDKTDVDRELHCTLVGHAGSLVGSATA